MPSTQYTQLQENIYRLRDHLLPKEFNPDGDYSDSVFTGVVAFRVLCHADIEDYFETRAVEIAKKTLEPCQKSGKFSRPALSLLGFSGHTLKGPPDTIEAPQSNKIEKWNFEVDIIERLHFCTTLFIKRIHNDNHGVREKNLLSILLPIGLNPTSIDKLFLSEMDDFGKSRGEFAHKSPAKHTTQRPNPQDEFKKVERLVEQISLIDCHLNDILREVS